MKITTIALASLLLLCCNKPKKFNSFHDVVKSGEINHGWIPPILPDRTTKIYYSNDLDSNTAVGGFEFDSKSLMKYFLDLNKYSHSIEFNEKNKCWYVSIIDDRSKWIISIPKHSNKATFTVNGIN